MSTIKEKVNDLCEENGITIAQLEKTLGFGNGTISRWVNSQPRADKLKAVAEYFNVTVGFLTGNEERRNNVIYAVGEMETDMLSMFRQLSKAGQYKMLFTITKELQEENAQHEEPEDDE